jgi:hypothetical protein
MAAGRTGLPSATSLLAGRPVGIWVLALAHAVLGAGCQRTEDVPDWGVAARALDGGGDTGPETETIAVVADTFVRQGAANTNEGAAERLVV